MATREKTPKATRHYINITVHNEQGTVRHIGSLPVDAVDAAAVEWFFASGGWATLSQLLEDAGMPRPGPGWLPGVADSDRPRLVGSVG